MGRTVKLLTTRGIIAVSLTLCYIMLLINETDTTQFLPVYMMIIGYMFGKDETSTDKTK